MTYPTKKIGEILELKYGKGLSKHERNSNGKYPVYGANGVLGYSDKFLIDQDAIIIGRKGSAGEITRVSGKFWPSDVTYYVLRNDQIATDYAFHLFKSLKLQRFAVGVKPGINRNRIYEIEIPLPPLPEQKKIVARIEKKFTNIDEAIQLREESQKLTAQLLPAALHEIFESGKRKEIIKNLAILVNGRGFKTSEWTKSTKSTLPIIRIQNLNNESRGFNYYEGSFEEKILVKSGDLLFSWSGSKGTSFGPHIWNGSNGLLNQHIFKVEYNNTKIVKKYFYFAMKHLVAEIERNIHGGVGLVHITKTKFEKLSINLPPLAEQKKIVKKLDVLAEKTKALQELQFQQLADLKALKQSILQDAFSK